MCIYASMYVHTYVRMYVRIYPCMYVYVCLCISICAYVITYIRTYNIYIILVTNVISLILVHVKNIFHNHFIRHAQKFTKNKEY